MQTMKRFSVTIVSLSVFSVIFLGGCKTEKKVARYDNIYKEKPAVIYIAPVIDKVERRKVVFGNDATFNHEVNIANTYMQQTLQYPVIRKGYYVLGAMASKEISKFDSTSAEDLKYANLQKYHTELGIDAILFTTIYKWTEGEDGEWTVYLNYTLKSAKTSKTLANYSVKAHKIVILDSKRDPQMSVADWDFAEVMGTDNGTTQRARILECASEYVLKNLPAGEKNKKFEQDVYNVANPECFDYMIDEDDRINVVTMEMEVFEKECFDL